MCAHGRPGTSFPKGAQAPKTPVRSIPLAIRKYAHTHRHIILYIICYAPRSVLICNNCLGFTTVGHHPAILPHPMSAAVTLNVYFCIHLLFAAVSPDSSSSSSSSLTSSSQSDFRNLRPDRIPRAWYNIILYIGIWVYASDNIKL